jgi:hypothetical protein
VNDDTAEFTAPFAVTVEDECALCGSQGVPGLSVPVSLGGTPRMRHVCRPCLSVLLRTAFQLLGHAGDALARAAVSVQDKGHA